MISGKLVLALLVTISGYTGYAVPGDLPRITTLSHDKLARQVCGRPCQVLGFTLPDGEIIIDEALAIDSDPVATSILVHELTHFLQIRSVARPQPISCQLWSDREREAFAVQTRWLHDVSGSVRAFSAAMSRLKFGAVHTMCFDRSESVAPNLGPKDETARVDLF